MNLDDANLSTSLHEVSKSIGSIRSGANNNSMHQYLLQRSMSNNSSFISHTDGNSTSGNASSPPNFTMIATSPLQHSFSQALRAPRAVRPDEASALTFNDTFVNQSPHGKNASSPISLASNAAGTLTILSHGADSSVNSSRIGGGARRMLTDYGKKVMERRAAEAEAAAPVSVEPSIESSNNLHSSSNISTSKKQNIGIKKGASKSILFSAKAFHTPKKNAKSAVPVKLSPQQALEGRPSTRPEVDAGDHRPKLRPSFEFEYDVIGPVELSTGSQNKVDDLVVEGSVHISSSKNVVNASPSKMMAWFGQQRQIPGFLVPQVSEFSPSVLLFEQQQQQQQQIAQQQRLDTVLEGASPVTSEGTRHESHKSQHASMSSESLGSCSTRTLPVPDVPLMAIRSVAGPFFTKKAETVTRNKSNSSSPRFQKKSGPASSPVPLLARKPAVPTFSTSPSLNRENAWTSSFSQNDSKKPLSPYAVKLTSSSKRSSPLKKSSSPQQPQQYDYRIQTVFGKTRVERIPVSASVPFSSPASPPSARPGDFSERMTSQPDFSSALSTEGGEDVSVSGTVREVEAAYNDFRKSNHFAARNDLDVEAGEGKISVSNIAASNDDDVIIDVEEIYDTEYGVTLSPRHGVDSEVNEDEDEVDLPPMPRPPILHGAKWNDGATAPKRTPVKESSFTNPILPISSTWKSASSSTSLFVDAPKAVILEVPKLTTSKTPLSSRYTAHPLTTTTTTAPPRRMPLLTTTSSASSNANVMMKKKAAMTPASPPSAAQGSPFTPPNGARYNNSSPLSQSPYAKKASFKSSTSKLSAVDAKERAQRLRTLSTLIKTNQNEYGSWMWDQSMKRGYVGV